MSFAGAQRIDDRRRRRLASASKERIPVIRMRDASKRLSIKLPAREEPLVGKFVPRLIWVHVLVSSLCLLLTAGVYSLAWFGQPFIAPIGPYTARLLLFPEARILSFLDQFLVLGAAHLSLFIWWGRSQSISDFSGKYSIWGTTTLTWLGWWLCLATNAHLAFAELVSLVTDWNPTGFLLTFWMVPCIALGNWLLIFLHREMQECRVSRGLLWSTALIFLSVAVLKIDQEFPRLGMNQELAPHLIRGLTLLGHWTLVGCLALHARHVFYFNAEPPARSVGINLWRWILSWFTRSGGTSRQKGKKSRTTRKRRVRRVIRKREEPTPREPPVESESDSEPENEDPVQDPELQESEEEDEELDEHDESGKQYRVDGAHSSKAPKIDKSMLKGLSKRERRRLQREFREQNTNL